MLLDMYRLRDKDPKLSSIRFLFYEYTSKCYWFEVVECLRKMLPAGLLTFILPGSPVQVVAAMLVALIIFGLTSYLQPHLHMADTYVACASQFSTFTLFLAILMDKSSPLMPSALVSTIIYFSIGFPVITCGALVWMSVRAAVFPPKIAPAEAPKGNDDSGEPGASPATSQGNDDSGEGSLPRTVLCW